MAKNIHDQIIALAAIFQFAAQVETLAKTGHVASDDFTVAVNSLFCQNPANTIDVYDDIRHLLEGLTTLLNVLKRSSSKSNDSIRYVMGILHLQKRLHKHPNMLSVIASRLEKSREQSEHFSITHDNVIAGLADIYSDTISTFSFRIQVTGEYQHLQQTRVGNQVRTLLFAAIRSAVLWRQLGGRRLSILFKRKAIIETAEKLLEDTKKSLLH